MSYNGKNYFDGDVLHVGGKLEIEPGACAVNVEADTGTATKDRAVLEALLIALKNAGIVSPDSWTVSIPTGITYANMATEGTATNSNKVTVTLEDDVITVATGGKVEDELSKVDHGSTWGKHYWLGFGIRTGFDSVAGIKFTQLTGINPTVATLTADDDAEAYSVGLASGGDIILYIKAESVRDNGGLTFSLGKSGYKTITYSVVIDESEAD